MISRIEKGETVILCWVQGVPAGPRQIIILKKFRDALNTYLETEDDSLFD